MRLRRTLAALAVLAAAAAGVGSSGATFTSTSAGVGNAVTAARDWTPPTVALANPGSPLSGTVTLTATASDDVSGVATVAFQRAPNGSSTFTTICTDTSAPYACAWSTTGLANAKYDLRAVATDVDGNQRISSLIDSRWVDNSTPSITLADPGTPLRGTVTTSATATSATGVSLVTFEAAPTGTTTFSTACTSTSANPSCSIDTTGFPDGTYDLRATLTTTSGLTAMSPIVSARRVDNTAPRGTDVQGVNKTGGTRGRLEAGDQVVLTYSEAMQRSSLISGWTTGSAALLVRVSNATPEVMTFATATGGGTPALGSITLAGTFVGALSVGVPSFAATAVLSADGTTVTITLGAQSNVLAILSTSTVAGAMGWTPSASALDLASNPTATTSVSETGAADVDF